MRSRKIIGLAGLLLTAQFAFADSSYQTTAQITGGQFVDALKSTPFIGRRMSEAFAPTSQTIMVRGNRKATVSKDFTDIVDLDKGEMIHIDNAKRTYTVVTFEQMREAATAMMQKLSTMPAAQPQPQAQMPPNVDIKFDTNVNNTGVSKMVNGVMAQEQIITLKMTITVPPNAQSSADHSAGQANGQAGAPGAQPTSGTFIVTADCWIAPEQPEAREIRDFDARMARKMMEGVDARDLMEQMKVTVNNANTAMSQMFGGHPGSAEAMAQMQKEMAKIQGTRIMEVVSMGGDAPAGAQTQGTQQVQQTTQTSQGSVTTGQVATDATTQTAASESSRLGGVGSALSNSVIGGWRRKKQQQAQQAQQTQAPAAQAASTPGAAAGTQHVTLIEMTNSMSNFSHAPVPESTFEIPAGYAQVQSPMVQ